MSEFPRYKVYKYENTGKWRAFNSNTGEWEGPLGDRETIEKRVHKKKLNHKRQHSYGISFLDAHRG